VIDVGLKDRFSILDDVEIFATPKLQCRKSGPTGFMSSECRGGKTSKYVSGYSLLSKVEVINAGGCTICGPYFGIVLNPTANFAFVLILVCDSDL
jgi:hypothetical protein